jgi:hypothetical protein
LLDRFVLLDLDDHGGGFPGTGDQLFNLDHILGIADKTQGDPIHALIETKHQILAIFVRQGLDREIDAGEIDPFVVRQNATHHNGAMQFAGGFVHPIDLHFHLAIVQQDR